VGVTMDTDGVKPDALDDLMANWDETKQGRTPKLILMVP
jgi:DNA-binding transcriptional MocR family regulator